MSNGIAALVAMRRSEQFKRATCSVVTMFECAMIGLALWSAHASVFTAVGLAFAAGMTLVILFMLIVEKSDTTRADVQPEATAQPAVAVAPSTVATASPVGAPAIVPVVEQLAAAPPAAEQEVPKTAGAPKATGNGPLPAENANGSLPLEHEPPAVAAR